MIKSSPKLFGALVLIVSGAATADSAYVYCVNENDRSDWDWLINSSGESVSVNGEWEEKTLKAKHGITYTHIHSSVFKIDKNEERKLTCNDGYIPQPSYSSSSDWYLFESKKASGEACLRKGYIQSTLYGYGMAQSETYLLKYAVNRNEYVLTISNNFENRPSVQDVIISSIQPCE